MSKSYKLEKIEPKQNGATNGTYKMENGATNAVSPSTEVEDKKKEKLPTVGMFRVFRFSTGVDKLLIFLGMLASMAHGAVQPLMVIVFGDMADTFIDNGKFDTFWNQYGGNITAATNLTRDEIMSNPENMRKVCTAFNLTTCDDLIKSVVGDFDAKFNEYVVYYCAIGVGTFLVSYVQLVCWNLSSYRQCQKIRTLLFQSILRQEISWFDTHEVGELNTRLADDVAKIQEGLGEKLGLFFQWFCAFIAGFVVGLVKGWKLTLVILAVSPLLAASSGFIGMIGASFTTKELSAYAKAGAVAEEVFGTIRTVVAFGGQKKESKRYNKNLIEAMSFGIRKGMVNGGGIGIVFLVIFSVYALAFWYGTELIINDGYTGGNLLVVFFCVMIGAFSLGNAIPNQQYFSNARGAAYAIYGIIDQVPSIDNSRKDGKRLTTLTGNIEFKNVVFNYPSRPDVKILKGFSLKVGVGHTVALVGASGCGKSTTVQLIQRFYDPHEGQILIDGVDIRDLNLNWLRQNIGIVSQEPVLFGTTIAENIRYGWEGVTQEQIEVAAQKSNAHDFIMRLPKKYQTLVGERGAQMSGGQKQRIAIARALVKDPKILLLDEATSALDTESEATVQEALDQARLGRTTIVIAHRLSTIRTADQIAGLDEGVVSELGSHDELMALGKIYHTLVTNQTKPKIEEEDEEIDITEETPVNGTDIKYQTQISSNSGGRGSFKRMQSTGSNRDRTVSTGSALPEEEEELSPPSIMRIIKLNSPEWLPIMVGCISAVISGAIQPGFAFIMSEVLAVFSLEDFDQMRREANVYCILFACLGVVAGTAMFLQSSMLAYSGEKLTMRLREITFSAMMKQEIGWFDDQRHNTGALTTRLATDASAVKGATGSQLAVVLQAMSSIIIGITIGFIYSAKMAAVILAFGPFIGISGFIQMKVLQGNTAKDKTLLEEAGKVAIEGIENVRTVASLTKEKAFYDKYEELTAIPYRQNKKKVHIQGLTWGISQGIIYFAYAVCFKYGSYLVRYEGLPYGSLYKVFMCIMFSAMSVGQASSFAPDYGKAKTGASLIFTVWDRQPLIDSEDETGEVPSNCQGVVSFEDTKFHYPTRPDVQVLRGLNIAVSPGKTLALVGSSGCGKSTSVLLAERFYDPSSGSVKLDKRDVRSLQIGWLRSQIGIVSQEPSLFDCSIRENIEYGDNSRNVSMDEVIQAARKANIHDFVANLPMGYETSVGDRGAQLSGGQKQRIAIARALVRNPKILLLDEATSALDTESEKVVQEALDRAQEGRTCIVIAHRLSTIRNADCIAVIQNGKVYEMGTHNELMALQGRYYKLNKAQERQA